MVMPLEPPHADFGIVQGVSRVVHEAIVEFACQQPEGEQNEEDEQIAQEQPGPLCRAAASPPVPGEKHDQSAAEEHQQQVEAEHQVIVHASVVPPPGVGRWHSNISPEPAAPDNAIPPGERKEPGCNKLGASGKGEQSSAKWGSQRRVTGDNFDTPGGAYSLRRAS